MSFGLGETVIKQVRGVFADHSEVEEVILYGSRAKGNDQVGSDIDLTMKGEKLGFPLLATLADELQELPIPYTVDLSIFSTITSLDLVDHIERVGKVFYQKIEESDQDKFDGNSSDLPEEK